MRIATHRFILVFGMALTATLSLGASSLNVVAQEATSPDENVKQIALRVTQINSFIGAQKEKGQSSSRRLKRTNQTPKLWSSWSCGQEIQIRKLW